MKLSKKTFGYIRDFVRILLVVLIFSTISIFWHLNQVRDFYAQYVNEANELSILIREVPKYVGDAFMGPDRENAFRNLNLTVLNIDSEFNILFNGRLVNQKEVLPPTNDKIKFSELSEFFNAWMVIKPKVNVVVNNKALILNLTKLNAGLITHIKNLQDTYWDVLESLGQSKADNASKIIAISKQINLMENLIDEIQSILTVTDSSSRLLKQFSVDSENFFSESVAIDTMLKNNISNEKSININKIMEEIKTGVASVVKTGVVAEEINKAIFDIFNQSPLLINLSSNLKNAYINYPKTNVTLELYAYGLGFLSFLVLILSMQIFYKENEENLKTIEEKNKLMQIEVEKLLKELPHIATGESSLDALISLNIASHPTQLPESFTYALSTLRRLVFNIGKTSKNVSSAATDAQKITQTVSRSSQDQASEISEVTDSVKTLATTIEQVSSNAAESANVALESVNIAGEGGRVVRDTIQGMQRIQAKIEETANLMRGLSDRSQEIGEIVSLIDGIAEQTNILSLNASIQAAMAGDAGRGFAVVADEVQRLAEKVSYATKEISTLVHAIQNDTTEVIVAMDHTKTEALQGVKSAQSAGATLEQIETVSRRLSDLIQAISLSAREEAAVSGKISQMMNDIKSIAQETATGSLSTVELIEKLSQFVDDLRNSVLTFKLPSENIIPK